MKKAFKSVNNQITLRLTAEEGDDLRKRMQDTTCRYITEYIRKLLFSKPIRTLTHNESIDDMIEELVRVRKELATLVAMPFPSPEERIRLQAIVNEIKERINQLSDHVCKSKL